MNDEKKRQIRLRADEFRRQCSVQGYGIINLFGEVTRAGFKLIRKPLGEGNTLGFTQKRGDDVIIYSNSSVRLSRELFTIAHELGHIFLHFDREVSFIDTPQTLSPQADEEKEIEANHFASALLMPEELVRKYIELQLNKSDSGKLGAFDIANIMSEFGTSFEATLNRLENLGMISQSERLLLEEEKNEMKVSKLLQSVGGNSRLNEVTKETVIPQEYMDYTIFNYNHNAIPIETLADTLAYYGLGIDDVADQLTVDTAEEA